MVMDAFGGSAFSLNEGFPGYILCYSFVGIFSILLHVDFNYIFISNILWVMWKQLYYFLQVSLQVVSEVWFYYYDYRLNPWECMRG